MSDNVAGYFHRKAAFIIDITIVSFFIGIYLIVSDIFTSQHYRDMGNPITCFCIDFAWVLISYKLIGCYLVYFLGFDWFFSGKTLGKCYMGLQTVSNKIGKKPGFWVLILKYFLLSIIPFIAAFYVGFKPWDDSSKGYYFLGLLTFWLFWGLFPPFNLFEPFIEQKLGLLTLETRPVPRWVGMAIVGGLLLILTVGYFDIIFAQKY